LILKLNLRIPNIPIIGKPYIITAQKINSNEPSFGKNDLDKKALFTKSKIKNKRNII
jgi:hypothetical protein